MIMRQFLSGAVSALVFSTCALAQQYTVSTVAGVGNSPGFLDGDALGAQFSGPGALLMTSSGLYIADSLNQRIRLLAKGQVTTIAGSGTKGYAGDKGLATSAEFSFPTGMAIDSSGSVYVADFSNNCIRKIDKSGNITTVAGNQALTAGTPDNYFGDGGAATAAQLSNPLGVAIGPDGNLYIADTGDNVIRKVDFKTSNISTYLSTAQGSLNHPWGIVFDAAGYLYVADNGNNRVARFAPNGAGVIPFTNYAGNGVNGFSGDGGQATAAMLNHPAGLTIDAAGNLYIAESAVNGRVRRVSPSGIITTIAGNGRVVTSTYSGDGGVATGASFNSPRAVAVDNTTGNIYIADSEDAVIRMLQVIPSAPTIAVGGVTNAAGFTTPISPGSLASIFGGGFALTTAQAKIPYPKTLGGVTVTVNGQQAPVFYVSATQINFQVPWSTPAGNVNVSVNVNGTQGNTVTVPVVPAAPGVFVSANQAAALNPDNTVNTSTNPIDGGYILQVFATGLGSVSAAQTDGQAAPKDSLVYNNMACTVTIGSTPATVKFCGLAPGWVGLWQVNVLIPTGLAPSDYPLTITVNGQTSNQAVVSIY